MSIKVMTLVWDKFPASGSELLAMLALADWCADDGGSLYPSMQAVASKIRVGEKQARRIVQGFVSDGYLAVVGNEHGGKPGTTKQFRLNVQKLASLPELPQKKAQTAPAHVTPPLDVTPPTGVRDPSHPCPLTPPTGGSLTVIEPSIEPPIERERTQASAPPAADESGADKATAPAPSPTQPAQAPAPTPTAKPAPTPPAPVAAPTKKARATTCPADFAPDDAAKELAGRLGVNLVEEQATFADYHCAKGSTMADWQAAFRNWVRNAARFSKAAAVPAKRASGPRAPAPEDFKDRVYVGGRL